MSTLHTDFGTLFLESYTKSGLAWVQTVGCIFIIYGYFVSNKKYLWKILLAHGISGFLGTLIENYYIAKYGCCKAESWSLLLLLNEVNWIINETSTVLYSTIKLETVIANQKMKKALHMVLGVCLIIFALLRFNIGRVRFTDNTLNNVAIGKAHSYAFLIWGLTDLIVFGLLIQNTVSIGSQAVDGILKTLFKSSIPRIMILVINTFIIVILGQIIPYNPSGVSLNNLNNLAWAIKGTYPIILLFDMHTTKDMLMMKQSSLSGSTSQTYPTRTFNTNHKHSTVNVFGKSQA